MATEYENAGKPVLFLEQNVNNPVGNRVDRWWDARDGVSCGVPWVIVDSGFRVTCDGEDFDAVYRGMVDEALVNPPTADISATYVRTDPALDVAVRVTNRGPVALGPDNWATVNVLVFERVRVVHTGRFVRSAGEAVLLSPLAPGQTGSYDVHLDSVPVADWNRATVLVLVDYQPGAQAFLAVQAAIAERWHGPLEAARLALPLVLRGFGGR